MITKNKIKYKWNIFLYEWEKHFELGTKKAQNIGHLII